MQNNWQSINQSDWVGVWITKGYKNVELHNKPFFLSLSLIWSPRGSRDFRRESTAANAAENMI